MADGAEPIVPSPALLGASGPRRQGTLDLHAGEGGSSRLLPFGTDHGLSDRTAVRLGIRVSRPWSRRVKA